MHDLARAAAHGSPSPSSRGPNPGVALWRLCRELRPPDTWNRPEVERIASGWARRAVAAIRAGAQASGARWWHDILANEEREIPRAARVRVTDVFEPPFRPGRFRQFWEGFQAMCADKAREVELEFHHNVVFEEREGAPSFRDAPSTWERVADAMAPLPDNATWLSPRLVRLRREHAAPGDTTSGSTDTTTRAITIYERGVLPIPFERSQGIGLSAMDQSIRHEFGHTVAYALDPRIRNELVHGLLDWLQIPLADLSTHWPSLQSAGVTDRTPDLFVDRLRSRGPQRYRDYIYRLVILGPGRQRIVRTRTDQTPSGREFEYAFTGPDDYIAEVYALALSVPQWLSQHISPQQQAWLRRNMLGRP